MDIPTPNVPEISTFEDALLLTALGICPVCRMARQGRSVRRYKDDSKEASSPMRVYLFCENLECEDCKVQTVHIN